MTIKRLDESLQWAAASLPFLRLSILAAEMQTVKARLESFRNPASGDEVWKKEDSYPHNGGYSSQGSKRWGLFHQLLKRAINIAEQAEHGMSLVCNINGPARLRETVTAGHKFASRMVKVVHTIETSMDAGIFNINGKIWDEAASALILRACNLLEMSIAEIDAHVSNARTESQMPDVPEIPDIPS